MVFRKVLLSICILLMLWDPVQLFPKKCFCHEKVCNYSWTSLKKVPPFEQDTEELIASHNAITSINNDSFSLHYENVIYVINLEYNLLSQIDSCALKGLTKLKTISLKNNVIEEFPASVFIYIPNVVRILIQGNKIRFLHPELFENNSKLKIIDMSYNKLNNLSSKIFIHNQLLTEVYLNNNKIISLPRDIFQKNPNLRVVHLGYNKITSIQSTLFHNNRQLIYANFSNNEIIKFGNDAIQQNCPSEHLDISDNKLEDFELCQIQCFEKPSNIDIRGNLISCDDHFSDFCFTFRNNIVNICDFKTPLTVSSRQKREKYSSSISKQNLSIILESSTVDTILAVSDATNLLTGDNIYFTDNENSSYVGLYNETFFNSTFSPEQIDFNLTTVATILQYDSPLVARESTMRGFIFIGIECSLAGALILRKIVCFRDKKSSKPVDTIELLSASEQVTIQDTTVDENEIHSL